MAKDFDRLENSNRSDSPRFDAVSHPARRQFLRGAAALAFLAPLSACVTAPLQRKLGFKPVPLSSADAVTVPEGYVAQVLQPWGAPVGLAGNMPAFRMDGSNSAADQLAQMGMHHDGMAFFPFEGKSARGLLVMNHEYADHGLLFPATNKDWGPEQVAKSQAAHGFSVTEIRREPDGRWTPVLPSVYARRITAATPHAVGGPAAGHALMRTAADPEGRRILGSFADCAASRTPWGSYVAGEENFVGYFRGPNRPNEHERRWGLRPGEQYGYRWVEHDERFDVSSHPNEPNRFGWIVEFDPYDPTSVPVKRTALGRAAHEGATITLTRDGRAVAYSGEDARFEYLYKFVSRDRMQRGGFRTNATLLDHGTLYVARFDADGRGRWLPLVHGQNGLTPENGFADQGEVLIKARQASDRLGATQMDRPEWIAVDGEGRVYCTLTNNVQRGAAGRPGPDAANPRADNAAGHIIRWQEDGDFDALGFRWEHFVLADEAGADPKVDRFACPDGLFADPFGRLWICTDMSSSDMATGHAMLKAAGQPTSERLLPLGNNMLLCADPGSGEIRRFLTGPVGCEITGPCMTPDGRTLFVNVQHPGETPGEHGDPARPRQFSNWPDQQPDGRPRSATLAIRRLDGGMIGT